MQEIERIEKAIASAEAHISRLPSDIKQYLDGIKPDMSSKQNRYFLSNLVQETDRYLEIGIFKGGTLLSAIYGKPNLKYYAVENFSQFKNYNAKNEVCDNFKKIMKKDLKLIEQDCFKINPLDYGIKDIDVYFYDGDHKYEDAKRALLHYYEAMNDTFIYIVDDWFFIEMREGTFEAIKRLELDILYHRGLFVEAKGDLNSWWYGLGVFWIKK